MAESGNIYSFDNDLQLWYEYLMQPVPEQIAEITKSQIILAILVIYMIYYLTVVVHKPAVFGGEGRLLEKVKNNVAVLGEDYWPTFWGFGSHMQTIIRVFLKSKPFVPYEREEISTPDGGALSLHWVKNDAGNQLFPDAKSRPTFLLMPGLTGTSNASYSIHLVLTASKLGYRSVVHHNRGFDSKLKTPRTFAALNTEDLRTVLLHIRKLYPESPVIACGISLGGMILTHYLCEVQGSVQPVVSAFIVSTPWNCFESTTSLESPINWLLFNRHLTWKLIHLLKENYQVFKDCDDKLPYRIDEVLKVKTVRQYDDRFICPMFGFRDWKHYYSSIDLHARPLEKIAIPTLYLNSEDDPFAPGSSIPVEKIRKCKSIVLALTKYGGHIGFTEGIFVKSKSIVENMFEQFATFTLAEYLQQETK